MYASFVLSSSPFIFPNFLFPPFGIYFVPSFCFLSLNHSHLRPSMLQQLLRRLVFDVPQLSEYCKMPLKVSITITTEVQSVAQEMMCWGCTDSTQRWCAGAAQSLHNQKNKAHDGLWQFHKVQCTNPICVLNLQLQKPKLVAVTCCGSPELPSTTWLLIKSLLRRLGFWPFLS